MGRAVVPGHDLDPGYPYARHRTVTEGASNLPIDPSG